MWIRYTVTAGSGPGGPFRDAAVWALAFSRSEVKAGKDVYPLADLAPSGADDVYCLRDQRIGPVGAEGKAGEITWSLRFEDRGARHDHVPPLLKKLPIVTRNYAPAILDLRVSGWVEVSGERVEIESQPGVLGHIWGTRNSLQTWAWGHCNTFPGAPDAVFEGLSARLARPVLRWKALSSFVLKLDGRVYRFSSARQLARNKATWDERRWWFGAREGQVELRGEAELPDPASTARVEYTNTDGGSIYCSNSRLARIKLELHDPEHGSKRVLESSEAAFEIGGRDRPSEPLHLPAG